MKKGAFTLLLIAVAYASSFSQTTILSGFEGGSYYQMANDMKSIIDTNIQVLPSEGNYYNFMKLRNLKKQGIDLCFLQFDVLYAGSYGFEELTKIQNIRALLPLGKEHIHLVTKKGNGINTFEGLQKKLVSVGNINQGTAITARFLKDYSDVSWKTEHVSFEKSIDALLNNEIDAFFFVGTAPVKAFVQLEQEKAAQIRLVPIVNPDLEKIYTKTVIKAGTYPWVTEDVPALSLGYALATNITDETPADVEKIEKLLQGIKDNIDKLRAEGHPAWHSVDFKFVKINSEIHDSSKKIFGLE